jgi:hypothetical protein
MSNTTANPQRGEVDIKLDKKDYILRLTTNSLARGEKLLNKSLIDRSVVLSWDAIIVLLFVGIKSHKLTIEQIGDLIDESDKDEIVSAVFEAWALHLARGAKPKPKDGEGEGEGVDPQIASPGIGTSI